MPNKKETCPKCGANVIARNEIFEGFICGTKIKMGVLEQSDECKITTLENTVRELREALKGAVNHITDHHSSMIMRREHVICPVCDGGKIEKFFALLEKKGTKE